LPLITLTPSDLSLGVPLPWDVLDSEGKVIFEKARTVDSQPLLDQLMKLGLYRAAPEPVNERLDVAGTGESGEVQISTLAQVQLMPGDPIQLQTLHTTGAERYQVRMIGVHAPISLLVSAPTAQGKLIFVKEGQQFLVRGFVGKDAVAYKTRVLKSNLSPFPYLHLAYPQSVQSMRIRASARVSVDLVTAVTAPTGQAAAARLVDLSLGGARLISSRPFAKKGDEVKLAFRINPSGIDIYLTLTALVRALHRDDAAPTGQVATGVEFVGLGDQEKLYLTNMVYQNLLKESL
jgi:c-di-GMP-binding flagellar brake protein YcgR